jgi:hypothetical protein
MKLQRPPLWLLCDVVCWIGVWLTHASLVKVLMASSEKLIASGRRRFEEATFAMLAELISSAEAWLDYAIARRAFRLAGLNTARVRFQIIPLTRQLAIAPRVIRYIRMHQAMDRLASRMATRLRRLAEPRFEVEARAAREIAAPATAVPFPAFSVRIAHPRATSRLEGLRIRAPPWRPVELETGNPRLEAQLPRSRVFAFVRKSLPPDAVGDDHAGALRDAEFAERPGHAAAFGNERLAVVIARALEADAEGIAAFVVDIGVEVFLLRAAVGVRDDGHLARTADGNFRTIEKSAGDAAEGAFLHVGIDDHAGGESAAEEGERAKFDSCFHVSDPLVPVRQVLSFFDMNGK